MAIRKPAAKRPSRKASRKPVKLKTAATAASVVAFLARVPPAQRDDAAAIDRMLRKVTRAIPRMWGSSIVGYGERHLVYESGRELDWFVAGFSPRKQNLTLYLPGTHDDRAADLAKLGKHSLGKGCLYVKRLADVDGAVLERMVRSAVEGTSSIRTDARKARSAVRKKGRVQETTEVHRSSRRGSKGARGPGPRARTVRRR